jgi:hypothetical protein
MPERELVLALDGGHADRTHELAANELVEIASHVVPIPSAERGDGTEPEDPSHDCGVVQERLQVRTQGVEPGRDERVHGLRHGDVLEALSLGEHPRELLGVQRVPARPLEEQRLRLGRQNAALEQDLEQAARILARQRRERDRRGVALAAAPRGLALEQLGPSGAEEEERNRRAPVEQVLEELEERVVGPVQVLDDEHARSPGRELLEEPAPRGERLLTTCRHAVGLGGDERGEPRLEPRRLVLVGEHRRDRVGELSPRDRRVVRLEDAGLRLHDLAQSPERDALAVGQAPAVPPRDDVGAVVERAAKLGHETALADPGLAGDRHELHRRLALRAQERLEEERPLVVAADERRVRRRLGLADPAPSLDGPPGANGLRLPLRLDRLVRLVCDRALGRAQRRLVDDHGPDRRRGLQPCGRVDDVAGDDPLAELGACAERDHCLARRDRRPHGDLETFLTELSDRVEDAQRRPHRALGVVLVRDRCAEDGHHRVADELLDGAAEALDVRLHALVVRAQRRADVLRVGTVGPAGEADEVDEEHRDDLSFLAGRGGRLQRLPAREAEACALRVLLAARPTGHHRADLRRLRRFV